MSNETSVFTGPLRLRTLASGSSGNATFLRFGDTRILIDAGIGYERIAEGLASMGECVDELSALLLTHEHTDHVKGLESLLATQLALPVYATAGTVEEIAKSSVEVGAVVPLVAKQSFRLGEVEVMPFATSHDAREPVGFSFQVPGFRLGFVTDLGVASAEVVKNLKNCNVLVLEANYDAELLRWSPYPAFLKRRIAGRGGHLSNVQARDLVEKVAGKGLEHIVLCHLSEKNNTPARAIAAVAKALKGRKKVRILAAARHVPGPPLSFRARVVEPVPSQGQLPFL